MKITIYTINECEFSKKEKEFLKAHNLQFEEKNLETNREFLTEMLAVSNNFAGTPVTKIEKDDGQIVVLKGFTQEEFDKTLGFTPAAGNTPSTVPTIPVGQPTSTPQAPGTPPQPPVAEPVPTPPPTPAVPVAPADPKMDALLNSLQQKATQTAQVDTPTPAVPPSPVSMPSTPPPAPPSPMPPQAPPSPAVPPGTLPTIPDPQF